MYDNDRISYLEESLDALRMQNLVLATALRTLLRTLPEDVADHAVPAIREAFEDEVARLQYEESDTLADQFHDATYALFHERER